MKGRNSIVIGIRVSDEEYGYLLEVASKKGLTVAALIKEKTVEFANKLKAHSVYTMSPTSETPPKQGESANSHSVYTIDVPPIYDPLKHMPGDTVTMVDRRGNKRVVVL